MNGYTKLFGSIIASTIWRESTDTKVVWITMLAMANKHGIVEASVPGLADMARVSLEETQKALEILAAPDSFSRTKDFEGRRIEAVDGGWVILNHAKYRDKMSADERRQYNRLKQQEFRERQKRASSTPCQQTSITVNHGQSSSAMSAHTEEEADEKEITKPASPSAPRVFVPPSPKEVEEYADSIGYPLPGQSWCDSYAQKGWMVGRAKMKDWKAAVRNWKSNGWRLGSGFDSQRKPDSVRIPENLASLMKSQSP